MDNDFDQPEIEVIDTPDREFAWLEAVDGAVALVVASLVAGLFW
jgi:hypothetical protein